MRHKVLPLALACALATGCMPGKDGVWVFFIPELPATDCDPVVTNHNYLGGSQPTDVPDPDWTTEEVSTTSDGLVFVQVFDSGGDEDKVAVVDNAVYLGSKEGGVWHFAWDRYLHRTETDSHVAGYSYTTDFEATVSWDLALDFKGNAAAGTLEVGLDVVRSYTETDQWDVDAVGRNNGSTPVDDYLEDANGDPIENQDDQTDCSASPCQLVVTTQCSSSVDVEGHQTDYQPDGYDGITGAEQPAGTN